MIGVREPLPGVVYCPQDRLEAYVAAGNLPTTGIIDELIASFAANADRPCLATADRVMTYAEVDEASDRFAGALIDLGLKPYERVLFQLHNSPEEVIAIIGCMKAGLIPTCTLPAHREAEIGYIGRHVDARAHIVQGDEAKCDLIDFATRMARDEVPTIRRIISVRGQPTEGVPRLEDLIADQDPAEAKRKVAEVPRDPYQVAIFQLSGGTTGVPKVIPRMQNDYLLNARLTAQTLDYRADDVMFMQMPIIHNAAMICCLMPMLITGGCYTISRDMKVESWAEVARAHPPTVVAIIRALVPRLEGMIELAPGAIDRVRFFWTPDSAKLLREKYRKPAYNMFGMSEGMNLYCREGDPDEALDWTVGRPMSPVDEIRLVKPGTLEPAEPGEIGEMQARGPYTLSGYYNAPERNRDAFTPDGFYKPGDLLETRVIDGTMYYAFAGRTKDVVDRGAEKINCEEVEHAVMSHPAVASCAVVGMPDPVLGERVCAYVTLRGGFDKPEVPEMQEHLQGIGMAKFKWPERIEAIDDLPTTKIGKLDKAALRKDITERLAADQPEPAGATK
ncbi:AMP-binding protein [Sphingobium sp.]|uniref:AMP-binding protein n=1 Tax=Sphingobium sp. TaxID=1912891 RepID=UPI0028BDED21|nr:AMP-binding protein [Sphingobium sp.]